MSEHDALLRAILDDPQADDRRLVYADYLEENGQQQRAEFIRVQVALAAHERAVADGIEPDNPFAPGYLIFSKRQALNARMHDLLCKHAWEWLKVEGLATYSSRVGFPMEGWLSKEAGGPGVELAITVNRGFVSEVRAPLAELLQHLPAILKHHPVVRVEATDRNPATDDKGRGHGWYRWKHYHQLPDSREEDDLPAELFDLLQGGSRTERVGVVYRWYESVEDAHDALSEAILSYARAIAREEQS